MRSYLVAGNWKMHGSQARVSELLEGVLESAGAAESPVQVAVLPPFVYLAQAAQLLSGSNIALGAQDLCEQVGEGAFTGEVSAAMLADVGCRYVVVGHSERRALYGESDELVAAKTAAALQAGLLPIVCVGETDAEREAGDTLAVVSRQLSAVLERLGPDELRGVVVAYEPVWAIGTGKTATPVQAQEVHAYLRALLAEHSEELAASTQLLYGGSVKAASAAELFAQPDIDGGLVGGASLDADEFSAICRAVS